MIGSSSIFLFKKQSLYSISLFLISIFIYIYSPNFFDINYCLLIFIVFLLSASREISFNNSYRGHYINFTLFFTISFFFVNFFYPVIIYPVDKNYFLVFSRFNFNENVITKSTALALIGYNSYILGKNFNYSLKILSPNRFTANKVQIFNKTGLNYTFKIIFVLTLFVNFILYFSVKEGILARSSDAFFDVSPPFMVINQCLINLTIILCFYLKKSKYYLFAIIVYLFIFLYVGDRGPAIQTFLVLLFSYNLLVNKITKAQLLVVFVIGFLGLTIVSSVRGRNGDTKSINDVEISKIYDLAMDLIINNRNLYAGYEYANTNGFNYGKSAVPYIFAPIPLLPSFITTNFFDSAPTDLSSGTILTNEAGASWGLGTNLIADLYMQFGEYGVVIFMFLLGVLIKKLENNLFKNFNALIPYMILASFSIYMARSSMFDSIRYIFWSLVIFYLIYYFISFHGKKKNIIY